MAQESDHVFLRHPYFHHTSSYFRLRVSSERIGVRAVFLGQVHHEQQSPHYGLWPQPQHGSRGQPDDRQHERSERPLSVCGRLAAGVLSEPGSGGGFQLCGRLHLQGRPLGKADGGSAGSDPAGAVLRLPDHTGQHDPGQDRHLSHERRTRAAPCDAGHDLQHPLQLRCQERFRDRIHEGLQRPGELRGACFCGL